VGEILVTAAVVGLALGLGGVTPVSGAAAVLRAFVFSTALVTVLELVLRGTELVSAAVRAALFSAVCIVAAPLGAWYRARRLARR
jgi:hypothetical protein